MKKVLLFSFVLFTTVIFSQKETTSASSSNSRNVKNLEEDCKNLESSMRKIEKLISGKRTGLKAKPAKLNENIKSKKTRNLDKAS